MAENTAELVEPAKKLAAISGGMRLWNDIGAVCKAAWGVRRDGKVTIDLCGGTR